MLVYVLRSAHLLLISGITVQVFIYSHSALESKVCVHVLLSGDLRGIIKCRISVCLFPAFVLIVTWFLYDLFAFLNQENKPYRRNLDAYIARFNTVSQALTYTQTHICMHTRLCFRYVTLQAMIFEVSFHRCFPLLGISS